MNNARKTIGAMAVVLALTLIAMPLLTLFNDTLTRAIIRLDWYQYIQKHIVPYEARLIAVTLIPLQLSPRLQGEYLVLQTKGDPIFIEIAWNCLGWQSLFFFIVTAIIGLQGDQYTRASKIKTFAAGLLGTFVMNIFRISFIIYLSILINRNVGSVIHDYTTVMITALWLLGFWNFAYEYLLENKAKSPAPIADY